MEYVFPQSYSTYASQMDGGSLDKLVPAGVGIRDEKILAWITGCTARGLKYLKDNLNIIHRGQSLINTKIPNIQT